jgi:hypothetical protein
MTPRPIALGVTLCDAFIVEEGTKKVTLVGGFDQLRVGVFPAVSVPFSVYAALMDGAGDGAVQLVVTRLETDQVIYTLERPVARSRHRESASSPCSSIGSGSPSGGFGFFRQEIDHERARRVND